MKKTLTSLRLLQDGYQWLKAHQQKKVREKQGCLLTARAGMLQVWIHMQVSHRGICEPKKRL